MKQRVLSVTLALCLCISSQSVAYASQEVPSQQKEVFLEETPDGSGTGGDENPAPEDPSAKPEDDLPKEVPDDPDTSSDENPAPEDTSTKPEDDPTKPEDDLPEEGPEELDPDEDEDPALEDASTKPEDDLPEEGPEELDPDEDEDPDLEDSLAKPEDDLSKETPEKTDTNDVVRPAQEKTSLQQRYVYPEQFGDGLAAHDDTIPTPAEVYQRMIALQDQDMYKEGTVWTDDEPYSDAKGCYRWKGGPINGQNIVATGCAAFAFTLSDAAFGSLQNRMYAMGEFSFEDIKPGDILKVEGGSHTVIVLQVGDEGVVVAEGNYNGTVHWGRAISKNDVMNQAVSYITRYPEGYNIPDDVPDDTPSVDSGTLGGLTWNLTEAGTLTISGSGAMPDFDSTENQPWSDYSSKIGKVVIEDGVTSIGSRAFENCEAYRVEIPQSVTSIGSNAFYSSKIISAAIPSSVKAIGSSAFRNCQNLTSVTVGEGVETIGENAFRSCKSLTSIALPASIVEVGSAAFYQCVEMESATFASNSKQVKLNDNIFTQCQKLTSVTLPQNIDCIGNEMFMDCLMLARVDIPQGAESIGERAFASCSSLKNVVIPDSVKTIETAAFSNCPLTDIYFTGDEEQWSGIGKRGDTATAVSKATIHYNYTPDQNPDTGDDNTGGDNDNNTGDDNTGGDNDNNTGGDNDNSTGSNPGGDKPGNNFADTSSGNNPGSSLDDNVSNDSDSDNDGSESGHRLSSIITSGIEAVVETWKPVTPDEKKRYACMGKEAVQYTPSKDNAYQIAVDNAMQGPMCFKSFEAVLGDYTIGRTYNIYPLSNNTYSMDKEIQVTIKIPSAVYKENREYKMICVTKGGQPIVYNDLDNDPRTITIKTNKFYAYALVYK